MKDHRHFFFFKLHDSFASIIASIKYEATLLRTVIDIFFICRKDKIFFIRNLIFIYIANKNVSFNFYVFFFFLKRDITEFI